jgi:hypothetical protein
MLVPTKKAAKNIIPEIGPERTNDLEKARRNDGQTLIPVIIPSRIGHSVNLFHFGSVHPPSHFLVLKTETSRYTEKRIYAIIVKYSRLLSEICCPSKPAIAPIIR